MKPKIPEMMRAVCLAENDGHLSLRHVPVPRPGPGEVLVKIAAAPINPSDLARIKSVTEPEERRSFIPGIEGCGTVVDRGPGILPWLWTGRRVACSSAGNASGTWAEYMVTQAARCIPLPKWISDEQGAMFIVNPLTAVAFFDMVRRGRHTAIINTAAASALGRIIELLGIKYKIHVIHIVRNEAQKKVLIDLGAQYLLNSAERSFQNDLRLLSGKLNATLVFDAVGGSLTREIMQVIPASSEMVLYGNLSGEQPEIDYRSLVSGNMKMSGFFLGHWLRSAGLAKTLLNIFRVRALVKTGLSTTVQARIPLEEAGQALGTYLSGMTAGKVLLVP
jgi:NADPH:quinone reductase-like Zn-dependent oxidoreductase